MPTFAGFSELTTENLALPSPERLNREVVFIQFIKGFNVDALEQEYRELCERNQEYPEIVALLTMSYLERVKSYSMGQVVRLRCYNGPIDN